MGESYDEGGVTYIGPRALVVGFMLYCAGFMALIYGANWISESLEPREPVAASATGPLTPAATASPAATHPIRPAVQAAPRAHAAAASLICAPAPPCTVRPGRTSGAAAKPATKFGTTPLAKPVTKPAVLPVVAVPHSIAAPPRSLPAPHAAPAGFTVPRTEKREQPAALPQHSATPQAQALPTPGARARQTPAALLVPFTSASGLTSSSGLDPRSGSHAPLIVGPTRGLGPNPAATPFGGTGGTQQGQLR
jgi:hypothetical protein